MLNSYDCDICYDTFDNETICRTNCSHQYCKSCLDKWFEKENITCPSCRGEIDYYKMNDTIYKIIKVIYHNTNTTNTANMMNTNNINISRKKVKAFMFAYGITFTLFIVSVVGNAHCKKYYDFDLV